MPIIKNSRKKPDVTKSQKSDEKVEKKAEKEKKTGACVQVSNLGKGVNKKMIVHDIFKGYKITNYGLYIETENSICTGKVSFSIEFVGSLIFGLATKVGTDSTRNFKMSK